MHTNTGHTSPRSSRTHPTNMQHESLLHVLAHERQHVLTTQLSARWWTGTYQAAAGSASCSPCPSNTFSPAGVPCKPCKATFRDNVGTLVACRMALVINDNTFVFDAISGTWRKMVAVNRAGTEIAWRYMAEANALTAANWATAVLSDADSCSVLNVELQG
jgi:hypothetical protein